MQLIYEIMVYGITVQICLQYCMVVEIYNVML